MNRVSAISSHRFLSTRRRAKNSRNSNPCANPDRRSNHLFSPDLTPVKHIKFLIHNGRDGQYIRFPLTDAQAFHIAEAIVKTEPFHYSIRRMTVGDIPETGERVAQTFALYKFMLDPISKRGRGNIKRRINQSRDDTSRKALVTRILDINSPHLPRGFARHQFRRFFQILRQQDPRLAEETHREVMNSLGRLPREQYKSSNRILESLAIRWSQ